MKEERNKSQLKPENQLFDPYEPLGTVLQKQTKAVSKQWHGHLEMRKDGPWGSHGSQQGDLAPGAGDWGTKTRGEMRRPGNDKGNIAIWWL